MSVFGNKSWILSKLLLAAISLNTLAFDEVTNPTDIILQTRFNHEWSQIFINDVRHLLIRNNLGDPLHSIISTPITFDLRKSLDSLPDDSKAWLKGLQTLLDFDLFSSQYELGISKLEYSLDQVDAEVIPEKGEDDIPWFSSHGLKGILINANEIYLDVNIKTLRDRPLSFRLRIVKPRLSLKQFEQLPIEMNWQTSLKNGEVNLTLSKVNLKTAIKIFSDNAEKVDLKFDDIIVPKVTLEVGSRTISIDPLKVKKYITSQEKVFKVLILKLLNDKYSSLFENVLPSDVVVKQPDNYFFSGDLPLYFQLKNIKTNNSRFAYVGIESGFCKKEATDTENCKENLAAPSFRRSHRPTDFFSSLREINRTLVENDANIVLSLSEEYLNKVLTTTIQSGVIDNTLKEADIALGPKGAFLLAQEFGERFHLYLDVLSPITGAQRIFTGRSSVHFPVKVSVTLKIISENDTLKLRADVDEILTDAHSLLEGYPELGLMSDVAGVPRFQGKVIRKILYSVQNLKGKTLIDFALPQVKGSFIEHAKFKSDGLGRLNALFKISND